MNFIQKLARLDVLKFSFAKSNAHAKAFANEVDACSMFLPGFGLGIPANLSAENQLRGVFKEVMRQHGVFLFNVNGVDLNKARKGFTSFADAEGNRQITEWELFQVLTNRAYLKNTIFHNGKIQFKKRLLWNSIMS